MHTAYSIGSRLVSFPVQWSGTQSGAKNLINFMNDSCDQPPLHSCIRGYHVYQHIWTPYVDEMLTCHRETGNIEDPHAVAVIKDENDDILLLTQSYNAEVYSHANLIFRSLFSSETTCMHIYLVVFTVTLSPCLHKQHFTSLPPIVIG